MSKVSNSVCALLVAAFVGGCSAQPCSDNTRDPFRPTNDIACASGELCYRGECVPACNAGAERSEKCEDNAGCKSTARPNCIDKFCSACGKDSTCVPALNICAPIEDAPSDAGPRDVPPMPMGTAPIDAGPLDATTFSRDSGVEVVEAIDPSIFGLIDVAQTERYASGQRTTQSLVTISTVDLRGGAVRIGSSTVTRSSGDATFRCDVQTNIRDIGTTTSANLGQITISNDESAGLTLESGIVGNFSGGAYVVTPALPSRLLSFSSTAGPRLGEIRMLGRGNPALTVGVFPPADDEPIHVPHELFPGSDGTDDTPAALRAGITVARPAGRKLVFLWKGAPRISGVRVVVRIDGPTHQLRCTGDDMAERIEVVTRMLDTFVQANQTPPNTRYPIHFERVFSKRIDVASDIEMGVLVDMTIQVRHTHTTDILFQ